MSSLETTDTTADPVLTPLNDEPLSGDDALALLDADILGEGIDAVVVEQPPPPLGRSWAFDWSGRRGFQTGGQGPQQTFGLDSLKMWCEKCLRTERGAHPIHPPDYGMDNPYGAIGLLHEDDPDLEQRIVDALTFHPRITAVRDFVRNFDVDDDYLAVSFTVVLDDGSEATFNNLEVQ